MENVFAGTAGYAAAHAVRDALDAAGFKTAWSYEYNLGDLASVEIDGTVSYWQSLNGSTSSSRVGQVDLQVKDLSSDQTSLNITQSRQIVVFSAPKLENFAKSVAQVMQAHFCQGH